MLSQNFTTSQHKDLKKVHDLNTSLHKDILEFNDDVNLLNGLVESDETDAVKEFLKIIPIEQNEKAIYDKINLIDVTRRKLHNSYKLNPTLKYTYCVVYDRDKNDYFIIDNRVLTDRHVNISHFFYICYKKHKITKQEFKTFQKHLILSYNMKNQLYFYVRHVLTKNGHKKTYTYLMERKGINTFIDTENKRVYRVKKDFNIDNHTDEIKGFIQEEIKNKSKSETVIKDVISKAKEYI